MLFRYHESIEGGISRGLACCSAESISFHYVEAGEGDALYQVLSDQAKFRALPDNARRAAWPTGRALSGYSGAPKENDGMWELLLGKIHVTRTLPRCPVVAHRPRG